ncbi:MAG TPA: acyl-CoA dehydrogenase [Pseudonocardiaceae bacterium]|nr:acyl-CoA dehydrogenase [Pseudonocardiaceae bacterium]
MHWKLSDEQNAYQEAFRDWLAGVAPLSIIRGWLDSDDVSAFESRFVADDWAGVGVAESLRGQGGGLVELALTAEELARAAAPSATWLATVLAVPALAGRADLLAATFGGETVALLVPADVIPDTAAPLTVDASGAITGAVPRVLAGGTARRFVVPARERGELVLRLVDAQDDGVRRTRRRLLDRTRSIADVVLDAAASEPLSVDGTQVLRDAAARAAVLVAADALGATARMLELAVEYSKQRKQFGVLIGSFQAVKHAAAMMLVDVEAARSVVYFAAASVAGADPDALLHAAAAKAQVTAAGVRDADSALTLHGAIGYTWEHDLHLFYKRAKLDEQLCGAPGKWNDLIADGLALV